MLSTGIVGAGVAGLFAAWELAKKGAAVTLFDKGEPGKGCSWLAAGMLAPVNELEFQELDLLQAGIGSRELYPALAKELGEIGLERSGTLEIGLDADDRGYLRRLFEFQQEQGLEVEWLSGESIREKEPFLSMEVQQAIWSPLDIQVDNRKLVQQLEKACLRLGVKIKHSCEIKQWEEKENKTISLYWQGGSASFDKILLTLGTGKLIASKLPYKIYPVRGEMISLQPPKEDFLTKVVRIRNKVLGNAYVVPKKDRILLGSTSEEKGRKAVNTAGGMLDILRKCYRAVPGIYELDVNETWAGLRPSTLSRQAVCDKEAGREIYHLNGLYRHGILLSPLLAKSMADLMLSGIKHPLIEAFHLPDPLF